MRFVYVILFFVISFTTNAQNQKIAEVKAEFIRTLKTSNIEFEKYYGFLDRVHKVSLYIGKNQSKYVAKAIFPKDYIHFGPDYIQSDKYTLRDIDADGVFHGEFVLQKTEYGLSGTWNDDMHIPIYEVELYKDLPDVSCGDFFFYKKLKKSLWLDNQSAKLYRNGKEASLVIGDEIYDLECLDPQCKTIEIKGLSLSRIPRPYLSIMDRNIYIHNGSKANMQKTIIVDQYYEKTCEEEVADGKKYSYEYLKTNNSKFDQYLKTKITTRISGIRDILDREETIHRFENVLASWVELTYFDDQFVSGLIYFQNNTSARVTTLPFIYDVEEDKDIFQKDIFSQPIGKISGDSKMKKVVLTKTGFKFIGNFDAIYGQPTKTIPFIELKDFVSHKKLSNL